MNRAVVLTHKYYGGEVPSNALQPEDKPLWKRWLP